MQTWTYLLHALSPLHAGTGQAADVIDLPIARMRSTGIPIVPGSSVKGVLREARDRRLHAGSPGNGHGNGTSNGAAMLATDELFAVFGPESGPAGSPSENAGALIVGDARLLALPVRSFKGTFAWVTSPLLLELARRDLVDTRGLPARVPVPPSPGAQVAALPEDAQRGSLNLIGVGNGAKVYLEDLDLPAKADADTASWAQALGAWLFPADRLAFFVRRFVVVDDETMTFLWETATQVDTRVRLDPDTRTVAKGALWTEESLPPETILLGLLAADRSRKPGVPLQPDQVLAKGLPAEEILQFGGKATIGRGRCRIVPVAVPAAVPVREEAVR